MRKIVLCILVLFSFNVFSKTNIDSICSKNENIEKRIYDLEKENAVLKEKIDLIISENDKKLGLLTWPLGAIITLLVLIYGFGAYRSVVLAKQEAKKAFKEDFQELKDKIEKLRTEAEKELEIITTVKSMALEEAQKNK